MKLNWLVKLALAFGLRKTESFLAAQPDLDAQAHHNAIALAETLGSKTMRAALLAVACDLLKAVDALRHDSATVDDMAAHASVILGAAALMFFRHAIAKRPEVVARMVHLVRTPLLMALLLSATIAQAQAISNTSPVSSVVTSSVSINGTVATDLMEILPGWQHVESFPAFAKAFSTNVSLNAVYSWRSNGGLSSGGAALAAPLMKVNWSLDPTTVWALYGGPSLVIGNDRDGAFSALEAAAWTDPFGPLLAWIEKTLPPLAWRPRQLDACYGYIGGGMETFGADGAGKAVILSAGLGFKF